MTAVNTLTTVLMITTCKRNNDNTPTNYDVGVYFIMGVNFVKDLKNLGRACQKYRKSKGMTQWKFGLDIGYTDRSISAFECGRSNNALILCEYVKLGFDLRGYLYGTTKD